MSLNRYHVTWAWTQDGETRKNRVLTQDGYSTVDNIPQMLSNATGIPAEEIEIIKVEPVADTKYRREFRPTRNTP